MALAVPWPGGVLHILHTRRRLPGGSTTWRAARCRERGQHSAEQTFSRVRRPDNPGAVAVPGKDSRCW
ncbi:hypothetical protein [Amycolatopsis sp. NPDC051071]|uniref:hypothetical protein n=1 Tax=Amycolatopsis sp. NPDC051071 TaxID=3154637 RepID=UPI0034356A10